MPLEVYCPTTVKSVTNGAFEICLNNFKYYQSSHAKRKFQPRQNKSQEMYEEAKQKNFPMPQKKSWVKEILMV